MKSGLLISFAILSAPALLSLKPGLALTKTVAAVHGFAVAFSGVSEVGPSQARGDVEEAKRLVKENSALLERKFGESVEIDSNSLTADGWRLKAKKYLTPEEVAKISNEIREALQEIHVTQYLENISNAENFAINLELPAKPESSSDAPQPPLVGPASADGLTQMATHSDPVEMARKIIEENRLWLEARFGEFVEIDPNSLTADGWQLKAKKYLTPEEGAKSSSDLREALLELNVAQYLEKVTVEGFVRLEVDPYRIIESSKKEWPDEFRKVVRVPPKVDEQKKILQFVTDVPLAVAEKESLQKKLKEILSRYGFSAFTVVIDSPPIPSRPRPSPEPAEPSPPARATAPTNSDLSTMTTMSATPAYSIVTPQGHVCFLRRLFKCSEIHPCLAVVEPASAMIPIERAPLYASARPASLKNEMWNDRELINRLIAMFQPYGSVAENLFGNRLAKDVVQVSYESITMSSEISIVQSLELANEVFGRGVHLYWQGDYKNALQQFQLGVQLNTEDARLWYFKGFCELALGRKSEAEKSIVTAIVLHEKTLDKREIARALERVQGKFRMVVESLRPRASILLRAEKMKATETKPAQLAFES